MARNGLSGFLERASEHATLKFLEPTKVPAPKVFAYALSSDPSNRVGVSYIMMQALPGRPFYEHETSPEQKKGVIEQVADILVEISKNPFPLAGSLVMSRPLVATALLP